SRNGRKVRRVSRRVDRFTCRVIRRDGSNFPSAGRGAKTTPYAEVAGDIHIAVEETGMPFITPLLGVKSRTRTLLITPVSRNGRKVRRVSRRVDRFTCRVIRRDGSNFPSIGTGVNSSHENLLVV
ncbi:hypothetical protein, partial [Streptomyces roseolus]